MKITVLFAALILMVFACSKEKEYDLMQIREIAWNYLSPEAQQSVIIDWRTAQVNKTVYKSRFAYIVSFNTVNDGILGPIGIYVDAVTKNVLGQVLRD